MALGIVLATASSCGLFEATDADPHRPVISNLQVAPRVVRTGDFISGSFSWFDAGADIESISMRDRNSNVSWSAARPTTGEEDEEDAGVFIFLGTSGTTLFTAEVVSTQPGIHHILIWVEDSKGSRSNQLEFTVTILL
jgi:hypothetical protein